MNNFDINKIKNKLLIKYGFFGSAIAGVELIPSEAIETAATNGEKILYNIEYMNHLTEDEQFFVFTHEVSHIAFNHIPKSEGKDREIWNTATDACVNKLLCNSGHTAPEGAVYMDEADIYNAVEIYEILMKKKQDNNSSDKNMSESSNENSKYDSDNETTNKESSEKQKNSSDHSLWEEGLKKYKENENKTPENEEEKQIKRRQKEREKLADLGENEGFEQNKEKNKEDLKKLLKELKEKSSGAGSNTSNKNIKMNNIGNTDNLIEWHKYLRESITYLVDWSFEDSEIENGVLTPNLIKEPFSETEIVLDASDSVSEILLKNFLRECKSIIRVSKIKAGFFDTKFYGFNEIKKEEDIEKLIIPRGGGTDFKIAVNSFSRNCTNKIIFTDGDDRQSYGDEYGNIINNLPYDNIIWVVFGNITIKPRGGKVIKISEEDLKRLCNLEKENAFNKKI